MQAFTDYIKELRTNLAQGDSTEHTHRAALQGLMQAIAPSVISVNEAQRISCGAPDLSLRRGKTPLAHIETKDIGTPLDDIRRGKRPHAKQFKRYLDGLPNWVLTDYLRFDWFVGGAFRKTAILAQLDSEGNLRQIPGGATEVENLLHALLESDVHTVETARELAKRMAGITHLLRDAINSSFKLGSRRVTTWLAQWLNSFRETLIPELKDEEFADMFAQTLAYGLFAARIQMKETGQKFSHAEALLAVPRSNPFLRKIFSELAGADMPDEFRWAVDDLVRLLEMSDIVLILADFGKETRQNDPIVHFYETFLTAYDPSLREKRGVYYTPEPVVSYIVRAVDSLLKEQFKRPKGLSDQNTLILDPAAGTATFLYHVIQHIREEIKGQKGVWPGYVQDGLLKRLFGFELLMAPYAVAHLKIGLELEQTGFKFGENERVGIFLTNTLDEAAYNSERLVARFISDEAEAAADIKSRSNIMIVLGNPPYRGLSANQSEKSVMVEAGQAYTVFKRGATKQQSVVVQRTAKRRGAKMVKTFIGALLEDYKWVDNKPLAEKKHWLNNDYVKFIRFGQWRVTRTGFGIVAFITANSYIDGPTFRGMRQSLLQDFDQIYILNLNGHSDYTGSTAALNDENVFQIEQGVSVLLAVRLPKHQEAKVVKYCSISGPRESKYTYLTTHELIDTPWIDVIPQSPNYLYTPNTRPEDEYIQSPRVGEVFPLNSAGFITARDQLVLGFTEEEVVNRIRAFADPDSTDADIRIKYFSHKKGEKYAPGDSRGWSLSKARQSVLRDADREQRVTRVLYRPFDYRYAYWTQEMIDWPRPEVSRQFSNGNNLALITARSTKSSGVNHFFCTNAPAEAKAGESTKQSTVFPLWNYETTLFQSGNANLSSVFTALLCSKLGANRNPNTGLPEGVQAEDVFGYVYAVFHSPTYRSRYAEFLKRDFPRIPLTRDLRLFRSLASLGSRLIGLHLLDVAKLPELDDFLTDFPIVGTNRVESVEYTPERNRVSINRVQHFDGVSQSVWDFRIGGYQVLEKWLKDRKERVLSYSDVQHWQRVTVALSATEQVMTEIDEIIPAWPLQ